MAFTRQLPCIGLLPLSLVLLLCSLLAVGTLAATAGPGNIAVFWGRNKDEGTLREACDTGTYNTILISFLSAFGHAGAAYSLDLSGHPLAGVGDDVKHCQSKGILVLLSIGGPATNTTTGSGYYYSLPSAQSAADLAAYLWDAYLGGSRAGLPRPFGDAALDGVDFFIDDGPADDNYDELARRLHAYNNKSHYYRGRPAGVTLTATVRCAYPDPRMQAALATGLFARVHVRLFGGDLRCEWGQFDSWNKWAAAYPASRVFVGVVASPEADKDAYLFQKDLYYGILQFAEKVPNYGGLMIWDRYYDKKNHYISST